MWRVSEVQKHRPERCKQPIYDQDRGGFHLCIVKVRIVMKVASMIEVGQKDLVGQKTKLNSCHSDVHIFSVSLTEYCKTFYYPLTRHAYPRFCSLDDQRVRTRVAILCSARYFLTNLGPTEALGNQILVTAITSYSNPDSQTIC